MATYEVHLVGEWRRPNTARREADRVAFQLRTLRFQQVKVALAPHARRDAWLGRAWDTHDHGSFEVTFDVEADTQAQALTKGKARARRALRQMRLCGHPTITFL